eukprot:1502279-Alexandrium_andersonii.AAC.1
MRASAQLAAPGRAHSSCQTLAAIAGRARAPLTPGWQPACCHAQLLPSWKCIAVATHAVQWMPCSVVGLAGRCSHGCCRRLA